MSEYIDPRLVRGLLVSSRVLASVPIAMGAAVLLGWTVDSPVLKSLSLAERVAMNPLTAVCFLLGGAALLLRVPPATTRRREIISLACAAAVLALALLGLLRFALGVDVGLDRVLFAVASAKTGWRRTRPSPFCS